MNLLPFMVCRQGIYHMKCHTIKWCTIYLLLEWGSLSSGSSFSHCAWPTTCYPVLDVLSHTLPVEQLGNRWSVSFKTYLDALLSCYHVARTISLFVWLTSIHPPFLCQYDIVIFLDIKWYYEYHHVFISLYHYVSNVRFQYLALLWLVNL